MKYQDSEYYSGELYGSNYIVDSITHLLKSTPYLDNDEQSKLIDSCFFAARAHEGQKRRSGEPYICHPIKVAEILAKEVQFNLSVLQAAVLHDVIEDTEVSKEEIAQAFSKEVANLVDGVSKLEKDKEVSPKELQALTFSKLVVAMEADPRVVMIKFADRMHNMQTLGSLRPEKRKRIAKETLDVYAPIASRLGMFVFKTELEELAFQHIYPWRFKAIENMVKLTHPGREKAFEVVKKKLISHFQKAGIKANVRKRRRSLLDVYKKLLRKRVNRRPIEKSSIPLIVITETTDECYRALGIIHGLYTPVVNKLADYIASPKSNGYQSIHTSILTEDRRVINFQIRSQQMHTVAESGIVGIWREHNQLKNGNDYQLKNRHEKSMRRWLGNIKNLRKMAASSVEFYEAVKRDFTDFEVQVLTPKGEPITLPEGATVIDFAYQIHTDLGDQLESAMVNGIQVPIDFILSQGQTVEIFTSSTSVPNSNWLRHAKSERARTSIRHYLRDLPEEALAELGYKEMERYLAEHNLKYRFLREMLTDIADGRDVTLNELLRGIAMHEMRRRVIKDELQEMAHKNGLSANIWVKLLNRPGALGAVTDSMGRYEANITQLALSDDMQAEEVAVNFKIHVDLVEQLHQIIGELMRQPLIKSVKYEVHSE